MAAHASHQSAGGTPMGTGGRRDPGRVVIIGAGPTGLGAAVTLNDHGVADVVVLEADDVPGGLSRSMTDNAGFTWDLGGHVHFSHYERYDRLLERALGDAWLTHERTATVRVLGTDVPYPFQHHLDALPEPERSWAMATLAAAGGPPRDDSFESWLLATFGEGICELFLLPYNRKVWQHPLDDMSSAWMGERVARPHNAAAGEGQPRRWGPNATFRYPVRGGTGAIWQAVARLVPQEWFRYRARVTAIDASARVLSLGDGTRVPYDTLISTLPLDVLVASLCAAPPAATAAAASLVANAVALVGIGVGMRPATEMRRRTWMYCPDAQSPYYRVTVLSNYSPANAPDDACYSLLAECSAPGGTAVDMDVLTRDVREALVRDGLVAPGAPLRSTWQRCLRRGYPVPTRGRDAALAAVHAALEPSRIFSRGRFGGWKYEASNQDHSCMQGVELVESLLLGSPEVTYHRPDVVNAGPAGTR